MFLAIALLLRRCCASWCCKLRGSYGVFESSISVDKRRSPRARWCGNKCLMNRTTSVTLGDELGGYVDDLLRRGLYCNLSEVVRDGIRALREREARTAAAMAFLDALPEETPDDGDVKDVETLDEARRRGQLDENDGVRVRVLTDRWSMGVHGP